MDPSWIFAALTFAGGSAGYLRKRSLPSLASGVLFGSAYLYAGHLMRHGSPRGAELAFGTSVVVFIAGMARGIPSRFSKPVPLILVLLGGVGTAFYGKGVGAF